MSRSICSSSPRRRFAAPSPRLAGARFLALAAALAGLGCTGAMDDGGDRRPSGPSGGQEPGAGGGNTPGGGSNPGGGNTPGGGSNPGGGSTPGGGNNQPPPGPSLTLPSDETSVPGLAPLRRLTRFEYENTVRDLLGLSEVPAARLAAFSADQDSAGSGFVRGGSVTAAPDARAILQAAEDLGAAALARMPALLPCTPVPSAAAEQDACADKFISGFGRRAYRRPLTGPEVDELKGLYRSLRQAEPGAAFPQTVASLIAAMLQSPYFLYRWELGPAAALKDGALVRFNQHEVASRLSYLFWSSMPDDKLFEAADKGRLSNPDQIASEARRLLADPRAGDALTDFHLQWMNMTGLADRQKDPSLTDYTPEVARAMVAETRAFVTSVFQGNGADGKLETLLTSRRSFANAGLAKLYGLGGVQGDALQPVDLDPAERAGLLTQGTFLTAKADAIDSHPIMRGDSVLAHLLCIKLEIPPDLEVPPLPEPKPGQTTRERVSVHSASACASCHKLIDPIGFAFENYDAIGRFRTMEEGKPVDASGAFTLGTETVRFKNAVELLPHLARSQEARDCMVTHWWRYAVRRQELAGEEPSIKLVREAFKQSGYDLRELLVAFTRTRAFSHRQPSAGEVLQ